MSGKKKIGVRIDEDVWERFREDVKARRGRVRGVLGDELETALEDWMAAGSGPDRLERIENDLATIKAHLADADADGGMAPDGVAPRQDAVTHTQTDADGVDADHDPDDPPHPKAAKAAKLAWLEAEVRRRSHDQTFSVQAVRKVIDDVWGFTDRTAKPMVDAVIDRLDAAVDADGTMTWG